MGKFWRTENGQILMDGKWANFDERKMGKFWWTENGQIYTGVSTVVIYTHGVTQEYSYD